MCVTNPCPIHCIYIPIYRYACLMFCLSTYLPTYKVYLPPFYQSIFHCIYQSVLSFYVSTNLPFNRSIYPIYLSTFAYIYRSKYQILAPKLQGRHFFTFYLSMCHICLFPPNVSVCNCGKGHRMVEWFSFINYRN